jgi:zinc transport system substrate-binding protein
MKKLQKILLNLCIGMTVLTGCSNKPINISVSPNTEKNSEILDITVSIVPQEYFVKKIGGKRVKVNVMVEPGSSAELYEPKPQQLKALSDAEAYITIGVPFETAWKEKIIASNPKMLIINSDQGIEKIAMIAHEHHEGEEDNHQEETEENLDPHIWLSPKLAKIQAENIYQGLVKLDPKNQGSYQNNLTQFLQEIDQLDQQIKTNLKDIKNRKFIVFHPAWGYFAQDYQLEQIPIEVGGQEPSAAELGNLVKEAKAEKIKVIFAQPQFSTQTAKTIAKEIQGEVILIDDLAANWSENLLEVSQTFKTMNNQ